VQMNRLVDALLANRGVIGVVVRPDSVSFSELLNRLGDAILDGPEQDRILGDPDLRSGLDAGFLPLISASEWERALSLARTGAAAGPGWRTVMIPALDGRSGLTIPEDSSARTLVALFTGSPGDVRVIAYDPVNGRLLEFAGQAHCGPPSRGDCFPGVCGGCYSSQVYDKKTGSIAIECRCPDQQE
jgi:hypothetical protein